MRSLDPKKAHGCDDLSINMIKICDIEIVKPLYLIYMKCLETGRFPSSWKKANVLPIHKKENSQLKKNYRPISLVPICGKIFEKLICDTIYEYLCESQLLTPNQSDFRPGDSTSKPASLYNPQNILCIWTIPFKRNEGSLLRYI